MTTPSTLDDVLRIQILPTSHPGRYQVSLELPGIPLLGGPALQPEMLANADEIQPLRAAYEAQIDAAHELEVVGVPAPPVDPFQLRQLGRRVAQLLPPLAQQGVVAAARQAQRRGRRLRIMVETTPETRQFLAVPWELMVLPLKGASAGHVGGDDFLLQDATISLSRQMRGAGRLTIPRLTTPISVQAFLAEPTDGQPVESATTRAALERALTPKVAAESWYAGAGTLMAIQERLRAHSPQVLHLLCHGEESPTGYGTRHDLILTHPDGFVQRVSAFDLAPMLSLAPDLQLVVLQACHSGTFPKEASRAQSAESAEGQRAEVGAERRALENIALALVRQGIPAVVAMQGEVGQDAAGAFVDALYQELAAGRGVDQAVAAGRAAMLASGAGVDWSLPVVYQGAGPGEVATWYTRLADRVDAAMREPAAARTVRGMFLAWALVLLAAGVTRWLLDPSGAAAALRPLAEPLAAWVAVGLVGPAIIATAQRGARRTEDLSQTLQMAARRAQWGGAYLGYALGGLAGLAGWVSLWALGVLAALPAPLPMVLFVGVLLSALGFSYVIARSQWRSALAIAPVDDATYTRATAAIIILAALIMVGAPLLVFTLPGSPFAWLLFPAPAALALAGAIVSLVLGGG